MQDKIIAAIAAYLDKVTTKDSNGFLNQFTWGHTSKIHATEIAAAIAPLVEAGELDWKDVPEWANYITTDLDGEVVAWEYKPKKGKLSWVEDQEGGMFETVLVQDWERSLKKRP